MSIGDVVKVLEKKFPYVEVSSVLGADSSYDSNRKVRGAECDVSVLDDTIIFRYYQSIMSVICMRRLILKLEPAGDKLSLA